MTSPMTYYVFMCKYVLSIYMWLVVGSIRQLRPTIAQIRTTKLSLKHNKTYCDLLRPNNITDDLLRVYVQVCTTYMHVACSGFNKTIKIHYSPIRTVKPPLKDNNTYCDLLRLNNITDDLLRLSVQVCATYIRVACSRFNKTIKTHYSPNTNH